MARLVRATRTSTVLREVARTSRAMTGAHWVMTGTHWAMAIPRRIHDVIPRLDRGITGTKAVP
jgi:hypothetical protein